MAWKDGQFSANLDALFKTSAEQEFTNTLHSFTETCKQTEKSIGKEQIQPLLLMIKILSLRKQHATQEEIASAFHETGKVLYTQEYVHMAHGCFQKAQELGNQGQNWYVLNEEYLRLF